MGSWVVFFSPLENDVHHLENSDMILFGPILIRSVREAVVLLNGLDVADMLWKGKHLQLSI